jgi:hypothetical protein
MYLVFACVVGIVLLFLARRVREWDLPRETWIPIALVGTFLLNPRIMRYDIAAITVPMLLIGWRALRSGWMRTVEAQYGSSSTPQSGAPVKMILVAAPCLLIPNVITVAGPSWFPIELLVLLAIFALGIWSLDHAVAKISWTPPLIPVIDSTAVAALE